MTVLWRALLTALLVLELAIPYQEEIMLHPTVLLLVHDRTLVWGVWMAGRRA